MLLIIEIILTVVAWTKGWRFKALIPVAGCLAIGLFLGAIIATIGGTIPAGLFIFDIIAVIVLIVMICNPPKNDVIDSGPPIKEDTEKK